MIITKKNLTNYSKRRVRNLSLSSLAVFTALSFLLSCPLGILSCIVHGLYVANSVLLLVFPCMATDLERITAALLILLVVAASVVSHFLWGWLDGPLLNLMLATILVLPHCVIMTRGMFTLISHLGGGSGQKIVWNLLSELSKSTFLCYFMALIASYNVFDCSNLGKGWGYAIFLLAGVLLYLVVLARSYVGDVSVTDILQEDVFVGGAVGSEKAISSYKGLYQRLMEYMDREKPYLNPDCQIGDMARELYTNKAYVSRMISLCTGMNYSRFMNSHRVRYAMSLYRENLGMKVSDMALLSGFKSTVTFNSSFRLFTNMTPSEWCREYKDALRRERPSKKQVGER